MALPVVAIVGRPNVGKSSLLNCLAQQRVSIVEPTAGVTRDRVSRIVTLRDDLYAEFVDTGGYGIDDVDDLTAHIERQIFLAVEQATLILFVVDAKDGIVPLDRAVADRLRRYADRVLLIANKVDEPSQEPAAEEFARLYARGKTWYLPLRRSRCRPFSCSGAAICWRRSPSASPRGPAKNPKRRS